MCFILLLLFRLALDFSYVNFVSAEFAYEQYVLDFNFATYAVSLLLYLSFCFLVPSRFRRVSDFFIMSAAVLVVAPLTSLYGLSNKEIFPVICTIASFSIVYAMVSLSFIKVPMPPFFLFGEKLTVSVSLALMAYLVTWFIISGAAYNINFNLMRVYEFRDLNEELTSFGVLAYLNKWVYQVFSLYLLAYFLCRKKYLFAFLVILVQLFFFGVTAHKSVLFSSFIVFGVWLYFKSRDGLAIYPLFAMVIVLGSYLFYFVFGDLLVGSILVRRLFYVPASLTYAYFDFFSSNEGVYWSNSVLSAVYKYPYHAPLPLLIGEYVGTGSSANNGYVSSGYAHAGTYGILIYSVVLGFFLKIVDVAGARAGSDGLALAITIIPLLGLLLSSDLPTALLTHGLLVSLLLLILVRKKYAF